MHGKKKKEKKKKKIYPNSTVNVCFRAYLTNSSVSSSIESKFYLHLSLTVQQYQYSVAQNLQQYHHLGDQVCRHRLKTLGCSEIIC